MLDSKVDSSNMRGGAYLGSCTTGFTLSNTIGTVGVATAHHCSGNNLTYRNHFSGSSTLARISSHAGTYGDLAMYSNTYMGAIPFFYSNLNVGRNTTGVSSPRVGTYLCKFGRSSYSTCDTVYRLNTARGVYRGMAATENRRAQGGDSGGPWYYGNTAYGIHSGAITIGSSLRDQFSPVNRMSSAIFGYTVMTY